MTLTLAFWSTYGLLTEQDERLDVERQTNHWAADEPRVIACRIIKVERQNPDIPNRWSVTVELEMDKAHPDNMTLWDAA